MPPRNLLRAGCLALIMFTFGANLAQAGGESSLDYVREFLTRYPAFKAEGIMTSTLSDNRPPYRCRFDIDFQSGKSMDFHYNTDAAKNIIPYDFAYEDKHLWETVYNRERTETITRKELGAPTRTVFNFVWDLLGEARNGVGLKSLLFNGLMSMNQSDSAGRTQITLERRLPVVPVKTVTFTFDAEQRLKSITILQANGSQHRLEIRRFRSIAPQRATH